jgi:CheY-like chemotaxis protein/HPt (histidine-containing phosphotransfer) domain-containing protein
MQTQLESTAPRVLLVDDDSIVLELLSLLLAGEKTHVLRASGGQEALDTLKSLSPLPDIVLVDHQMPGVSGVEVGRYVKSLPEPRPRVIAMSASPLPEDELTIFDDFLHKPVDQDLLRAAIAGSSARPSALPRGKQPPSLDSNTVTKLQAIMPPSAIRELYTVYVADTRERISELERYSANGDEDALRRCAHALKGAASMAGVSGIASIADGLEAGRLPRQDHGRLFHQLRSACDDVEQTMIKSAVTNSAASGEAR